MSWGVLYRKGGVRKNGVCNRSPYRRCGVDTEIPYRLLSLFSAVAVQLRLSLVIGFGGIQAGDTEFPYWVRIVDRGTIAAPLFAAPRFRFLDVSVVMPADSRRLTKKGFMCVCVCLSTPDIAIPATIHRSLWALRAQRLAKKSQKESFWGSAKKSPKNSRKSQKIHQKVQFWVFFDFFGYFRGLLCRPPKRLFLRFFCDFGPGGPRDSCKWSLGSQTKYDWAKVPPYNGSDPTSPLEV